MSSTRTGQNIDPQPLPDAEARTVPRPKSAGTRLSIEELEEVESAAKRDGKTLAEWPVSYTHLDVYKRQGLQSTLRAWLCLKKPSPRSAANRLGLCLSLIHI